MDYVERSKLGRSGLVALLMGLTALCLTGIEAVAQTGATDTVLETLDVNPMSGDRVKLTFRLSGPAPKADSFTINDPARVVIDLPEVRNAVAPRFRQVKLGTVQSVSVSEAQNRTRATIKLTRMVPHEITQEGDTLTLVLSAGGGASTQPVSTRSATAAASGDNGDVGWEIIMRCDRAAISQPDADERVVSAHWQIILRAKPWQPVVHVGRANIERVWL